MNNANIPELEKQEIILNNILTRTSDRLFDVSRAVGEEDLMTILRAGMAAPSGVNKQPWHFVLVTNRGMLDNLAVKLPYCRMANQATAAIVVCGDKSKFLEGEDNELWVQDVSAATENILLAAHALGIGSVWTAVYPHQDRMATVFEVLDLQDSNLIPFNVIPLGYVQTSHDPLDKWDESKITFRT